jgi:hypothetical protein
MKSIWVTAAILFGLARAGFATPLEPPPACVTNTLDNYLSLGADGCSMGEIAFSNFSFSVTSFGGGAVPIPPSAILVTPTLENGSLTFSSSGFSVTGSEFVTYLLGYSIDPHPIIRGFDDTLDVDGPTFPGLASITTDLCLLATFTGDSCLEPGVPASLHVFDNGIIAQLSDSVDFPPLAVIGVRNTIDLHANGANADFTSFTNTAAAVPEPATWLLVSSGLLGLLVRRRRRRLLECGFELRETGFQLGS